jgi:methylase of polypeptide subunit release factors
MYSLVDFRLSSEAPVGPTGFPKFKLLQKAIARLDLSQRTLFRLLRLGESVTHAEVEQSILSAVLAAFARTGLLVRTDAGVWHTPGLLLVPVDGVLVFVSIPPSYPSASKPATVWFDLSSYIVAKALPGSLANRRVLDICSGSGIQSLLCATRGATTVTGLEIMEDAVAVSRMSALLNGVGGRTDFRRSDKLAALEAGEQFDFIICNTPYAPVLAGNQAPESVGEIGNGLLLALIDQLPERLSQRGQGLVASWRSIGTGGASSQRKLISSQLAKAGLSSTVFVDRASETAAGVLSILQTDVKQRYGRDSAASIVASVRKLFQEGEPVDGFYNQLFFFKRDSTEITKGLLR